MKSTMVPHTNQLAKYQNPNLSPKRNGGNGSDGGGDGDGHGGDDSPPLSDQGQPQHH